jgi:small subunit ribosomal protein S6
MARAFFRRRKSCPFSGKDAPKIDYKDVRLLQGFVSERGKIAKTETWGLRGLAYRIAKNRKAHYVALDIDAPAAAIAELERQSNINEDIIRFLTLRVDEHESGPSAMMRRGEKERERRSDRGDRDERPNFRAREEEVE